MMPTIKEEP